MKIVVLTGAGISAESGLGTFRDDNGIWSKIDLSEVATMDGFIRNPAKVHEFYNARRTGVLEAKPNIAHDALARLEAAEHVELAVVTQNIDDLHERAGSKNVLHMHGSILLAKCASCNRTWDAPREMHPDDDCPFCHKRTTRPDVVWFGEIPYWMDEIHELLARAELFASIGTSGQVYPAAGFAEIARDHGAPTIALNLDRSDVSPIVDQFVVGPATSIVPEWVEGILRG